MWRTLPTVHAVGSDVPDTERVRPPLHGTLPVPQPDDARLDLDQGAQPPGTMSAPDLRGMASRDALRLGRVSDLHVWVEKHPTDAGLWDRVVAQDPAPGAALTPGATVKVTVGARPSLVVPDVRGGEESEMLAVLRDAGLRPEKRLERRSDSVPEGHIVRTRPRAGSTVSYGTKLTYVVATARPPHPKQARRLAQRDRGRRLPTGSFLSLPFED